MIKKLFVAILDKNDEKRALMDIVVIIQLFIPVITFAMGYFLTDIGYRRDRKISLVREKFDKLYHPFYMMALEQGTDRADGGFAIGEGGIADFKPFLDHLSANSYLASSEGQKIIWETRYLLASCMAKEGELDKEADALLGSSIGTMFEFFMQEYMKSANKLGYELAGLGTFSGEET